MEPLKNTTADVTEPCRSWAGWVVRIAAWLVVLAAIARLLADPTRAWLDGRLHQMHVRLESEQASKALFDELNLARHFDRQRYALRTAQFPGDASPNWITLKDTKASNILDSDTWLWLREDGRILLPPLANPLPPEWRVRSSPDVLILTGRGGRHVIGATCMVTQQFPIGDFEWLVWLHREDRWVNVLRMKADGTVVDIVFEGVPSMREATAVSFKKVPAGATFDWDPATESFKIPPNLNPAIHILDPLPDQVWQPPDRR